VSKIFELAPEYIRSIAAYQPGKPISDLAREMGLDPQSIVKLASNENPLGMSPKAHEAVMDAMGDIARYPDGGAIELRLRLASLYQVNPNQIVFGNGSNDILELVARTFLTPQDEAVFSEHAFAIYALASQAVGAKGIAAPAKDFGHDLEAMLGSIHDKTRVVFIANPNNPTGTLIPKNILRDFIERVPKEVLIVLDEAYDEYLLDQDKSEAISWVNTFDNLLVSRTFSKAFGLAGLRLGFAVTSEPVANLMNRVRQPFNVNGLAQVAAIASLDDEAFVERSRALNQAGMKQITDGLKALGLSYIPSFGNFVSFEVPNVAEVNLNLLKSGVIVRPIANYGLPSYLRVSIGLFSENASFLEVLGNSL
jgi:histidinol-phosphate aminotransferase